MMQRKKEKKIKRMQIKMLRQKLLDRQNNKDKLRQMLNQQD
jgi:hypothetical protein